MAAPRNCAAFLAAAFALASPVLAAAPDGARLVDAAHRDDAKAVEALLKNNAPVNAAAADGATALSWAVANSDAALVNRLLKAGANPNLANDYGVTPLILAAQMENTPVVKSLLAAHAGPNQAMWTGETALMFAARGGVVEVMKALVQAGADVNQRETRHGQTALMWASAAGNEDAVRFLIAHKADVSLATPKVKVLILSSGSPKQFDNSEIGDSMPGEKGGLTALMFAAGSPSANVETIDALLDADPTAINRPAADGTAPLLFALYQHVNPLYAYPHDLEVVGDTKMAAELLKRGANPNQTDINGLSPLMAVVFSAYGTEVSGQILSGPQRRPHAAEAILQAKLLLDHGADPNIRASFVPPEPAGADLRGLASSRYANVSPFLLAGALDQPELVKMMMATGRVNINTPREGGNTPLMDAVQTNSPPAIQALVAAGADVNAVNAVTGQTALHMAATGGPGSGPIVQLLVDHGARYDVKDASGKTAVDLAKAVPVQGGRGGGGGLGRSPLPATGVVIQIRGRPGTPGPRGNAVLLGIAEPKPPATPAPPKPAQTASGR